jgi:hypothetical protein
MRHVWSVLCNRVIVEAYTNRISLIDLSEVLSVNREMLALAIAQSQGEPVRLPANFFIVSLFWIESDHPGLEIRLATRGPDGGNRRPGLNSTKVPAVKDKKNATIRVMTEVDTIAYYGDGLYEIGVEVRVVGEGEWRMIADMPLLLKSMTTDEQRALLWPTACEQPSAPLQSASQGLS